MKKSNPTSQIKFTHALAAAHLHMAQGDPDPLLNGVHCSDAEIMSTDRNRFIIIKAKIPEWAQFKTLKDITVKALIAFKEGHCIDTYPLEDLIQYTGITPLFIEGNYPDLNNLLPQGSTENKVPYNPVSVNYLYDACLALHYIRMGFLSRRKSIAFTDAGFIRDGKKIAMLKSEDVIIGINPFTFN